MTPQELKNSILQLAIQGRLVPQCQEEGTAEELYKQIQAEKQALIKAGKIKKDKPLPEITEDEKPFDIPESWKWVRLCQIGITQTGNTPAKSHPEYIGNDIPFITPGDIQKNSIFYGNQALSLLGKQVARVGYADTILQVCIGGSIGKAGIADRDVTFNQQINAISPFKCDSQYLFAVLTSKYFVSSMQARAGGTATPIINRGLWDSFLIPLPPFAEQKRIVAKIEELLPLIDRYEAAWSRLENFNKRFPGDMQKSILQMAIQGKLVEQRPEEGTAEELYRQIQTEKQALIKAGKFKKEKPLPEISEDEIPFDIPESWRWVRLGAIGSWSAGATPSRTNPEYYGGKIPWLKTGDLNDGEIASVSEFISELALEKTSVRLNPVGSVLMAMYGATIGKLGIATIPLTTNQACCACIPFNGVYNKYLFFYLMAMRKSFVKLGEGGAQPNISKEKIVDSLIPLPPLAEQKRIVAKLEELLPLCERLK